LLDAMHKENHGSEYKRACGGESSWTSNAHRGAGEFFPSALALKDNNKI
jgi:hypothetical protein